ncbi:MAG TPA: MFS transporter [Candidatus Acidoferrum sp.]|nr:MFS transporter [Candidatus Acidoferrum sp.]
MTSPTAIEIEARTIRKLRLRILPFVFLLYVIAYLDRINIGFAALTMNKELSITSQQFGLLLGIFFLGYFIFEVPSNLLLYKIGARIWIARILISWGTVAVLTGFAQTVHQLYLARFLLGVAEAGYFPGIVLYLTYWFRRQEQAQAIALFMTAVPVAGFVGAPLSGLILDHIHWLGVSSWRWLLILEGGPAVICGLLGYFLLPNRPAEAKFLNEEERDWINSELLKEEQQKLAKHRLLAMQVFTNGRVWHLICIGFALFVSVYTINFWIPQLMKSLLAGHSNTAIGFVVMIPNLAAILAMFLVSRSSDRKLERRYHAAIPAILGGMAFLLLSTTHSSFFSVALLSLAAAGVFSFYGPYYALPCEFLTGLSAASGIALINSFAHLGGFIGPRGRVDYSENGQLI